MEIEKKSCRNHQLNEEQEIYLILNENRLGVLQENKQKEYKSN